MFIILVIMLLVVMCINLVSLSSVDYVTKYFTIQALEVANRVLALLLAALAMETVINGFGGVIQGAAKQLLNT